jgi:hypothetical protein
MKFFIKNGVERCVAWLTLLCCALIVTACGGGGGSAGTTLGTSGGVTGVALSLVDANGNTTNSLTNATPIIARAKVVKSGQSVGANQLVTFLPNGAEVTMSPSTGKVLTDANGVASVTLVPKDPNYQAGDAGTITATSTIGSAEYSSAAAGYQLGVSNTTINLVSPASSTVAINAFGTTEIAVDVFVAGQLYTTQPVNVSFNSLCVSLGKATLASVVRTINGRARAIYTDNGCGQSDTITATVSGTAKPATLTVIITPPSAGSIKYTGIDVGGNTALKTIALKGTGSSARPEFATLTFTVLDTANNPIAGKLVNFSVFPAEVTLSSATGVSDAAGKVTVVVQSGTKPTTFRVTAAIPGGPSVVSDSISVTTGAAVQTALSLSAEKLQIEGWETDNITTNVNILLADAFGNPVADGASVNFVTDSGAIGGSSGGNCLTTNGGCTVVFRSQEPRFRAGNAAGKRPGVATITATTSSGETLTGKIGIYISSSFADNVYAGATKLTQTPFDLGTITCDVSKTVSVQVNDVNNNPMPVGTTISITDAAKVTGAVFPGSVSNVGTALTAATDLTGRYGTPHDILVKGPASAAGVCGPDVKGPGFFYLTITSPAGGVRRYPFSITVN